jgi:uncharacterized protein (DUF2252 family)
VTAASATVPPHRADGDAGRAARARVRRSSQAVWRPAADRESALTILQRQDESRVPDLVPIRYGRMLVSPFAFYRGAAAVMAADLGAQPSSGLIVQLCGDAHLSNFGGFASPDRTVVFDINDFDETLPGPFDWDVKRLAASIEIAGRDRGFRRTERDAAVTAAVAEYRAAMRSFAAMGRLEAWYTRLDERSLAATQVSQLSGKALARAKRSAEKARSKDHVRAFARLTTRVDGQLRIASAPPLIVAIEDLVSAADADRQESFMRALVTSYRQTLTGAARRLVDQYHYAHLARKVVGVGSVGTRAWVILLTGRDEHDPLFLQVKEAQPSVLEPYAGRSRFAHHGRRVVEGQWLMQASSDILLGWVKATGIDGIERDFYVRQLWDWKRSAEIETMTGSMLAGYARMCGWTLAHGHARSGDPTAIAAYMGRSDAFDRAITTFATRYADQAEADFKELKRAAKAGQVEVIRGL